MTPFILTESHISEIERLSGLFLSPREIAVILDLNIQQFLAEFENEFSPLYLAYLKGKTMTKMALREKTVSLAKMGSPPAQTLTEKFIEEQEINENE